MRAMWMLVAALAACGNGSDTPDAPVQTADAITLGIVEAYGKAWDTADATVRRRLLEYSAVDTLAVYEPSRTLTSRDAVDQAIAMFHTQVPGGTVPLVGNLREHGSRVWLRWKVLNGSGGEIDHGTDLMKRADDMRLERVHSFFGSLPITPSTPTAVQQALIDAWNQDDADLRNTALMTAVTDDVVVLVEGKPTVTTRSSFSATINVALAANPGSTMAVTTGYLSLNEGFMVAYKVTASDGTTELSSGVMFAVIAADGRISEAVYFIGADP